MFLDEAGVEFASGRGGNGADEERVRVVDNSLPIRAVRACMQA